MLLSRNFNFLGGYLVVTARYLVVTTGYWSLPGGYCSLLVVTARYHLLLLVPIFSMNRLHHNWSASEKRCGNFHIRIEGLLNIYSIRNKFNFFAPQIKGNIDVPMISETKFNENFPAG